jgi:hypothetical protein
MSWSLRTCAVAFDSREEIPCNEGGRNPAETVAAAPVLDLEMIPGSSAGGRSADFSV